VGPRVASEAQARGAIEEYGRQFGGGGGRGGRVYDCCSREQKYAAMAATVSRQRAWRAFRVLQSGLRSVWRFAGGTGWVRASEWRRRISG
jgi:hypothetical protein